MNPGLQTPRVRRRLLCPMTWALLLMMARPDLLATESTSTLLLPDGTRHQADLVSLARGQLTLRAGPQLQTVPLSQIVRWQRPHRSSAPPGVLLIDGSFLALLSSASLQLRSESWLTIDSPIWGTVDLPWHTVRAMVVSRSASRREATCLCDELASTNGSSDQIWLDNGDRLSGNLLALGNQEVVFRLEQRELTIGLERVRAILPAPSRRPESRTSESDVLVGLSDGSQLCAGAVDFDEQSLLVECLPDVILETDPDLSPTGPLDLVLLQPLGGRTVYLSDREPLDYLHLPYLSVRWSLARDRNLFGDRLCVQNVEYAKGLGMHSTSCAAYVLQEGDLQFDALLAVDESAGQGGSVVFRVFLDRDGGWRPAFESPTIRGGEAPRSCSVDLRGASRIALVVDYADRADELDHADWLDVRILRSTSSTDRAENRRADHESQDE